MTPHASRECDVSSGFYFWFAIYRPHGCPACCTFDSYLRPGAGRQRKRTPGAGVLARKSQASSSSSRPGCQKFPGSMFRGSGNHFFQWTLHTAKPEKRGKHQKTLFSANPEKRGKHQKITFSGKSPFSAEMVKTSKKCENHARKMRTFFTRRLEPKTKSRHAFKWSLRPKRK